MTGRIRKAFRASVIGAIFVAATFMSPSAAHAALGGCSADIIGERTGAAYCSLATDGSHFRAKVTCVKYTTGQSRIIYGPRRYSPVQSAATCLSGEYAADAQADTVY